ncbi:TIGR03086 family metal-binding protein [Saccharopolyspora oryzae]|uniref:TIGR03086 family metal-binding protein n=1 Tax=Saccharopolyspora oryzae TaxID=2997343 RepID=A0ABT4V9X1_9PSEU|nr:TIGR03086 family metal-binding protein [Saccharopolyspora oryzae]MDA3630756.1 TIGR03086 family metal-binding protein [Saccharopolyspora oryzae]
MPALKPAADRMAELLANVTDAQLTAPTPCSEYTAGDLIDHISGLSLAFTAAAAKDRSLTGQGPSGDASRLPADWRTLLPEQLTALAKAWEDPAAWEGMTQAGGIELPGAVAGLVALDELVVHGWDLAKATGQPFTCDEESLAACLEFVGPAAENPGPDSPFGKPVEVAADAPALDRLVALTGRTPTWHP